MASTKSSAKTSSSTKSKLIIKPENPIDFKADNVIYDKVYHNTDIGAKWSNIYYSKIKSSDSKDRLLIVARGCKVNSFKEVLPFGSKEGAVVPRKEGKPIKYQIFLGLKDEKFIEMVKSFEKSLIAKGVELSKSWFDNEMNEEECTDMLKATLTYNEKYGYAIGGTLSRDFSCKSKTEALTDTSDLYVALAKHNIVDICFSFNKISLGVGKYSIGLEINQANIISVGSNSEYQSNSLSPQDFVQGKIGLSKIKQHPKGGKFIEPSYDGQKLRIVLKDIVGRIFKFEKDDTTSYSLSIRPDADTRKMLESIEDEKFNLLLPNSKEYYGKIYTKKVLKTIVKSFLSYNKSDQEKIKAGQQPVNQPSFYLKIPFYNVEKGFEGKVVNVADNKPIQNIDSIINKDLSISSLEFYWKHIWIGPKGTSSSFPINKCKISFDVPEYNMDDAGEDEEDNDVEDDVVLEIVEEDEEAANSDED